MASAHVRIAVYLHEVYEGKWTHAGDTYASIVWIAGFTPPTEVEWDSEFNPNLGDLAELKVERDVRLRATDWWAVTDLTMETIHTTYRQALWEITNTYTSIADVVWPTRPDGPVTVVPIPIPTSGTGGTGATQTTVPTVNAQTSNDPAPTITGTTGAGIALTTGETFSVVLDGTTYAPTVATDGTWSFTSDALIDGTYSITATFTNAAGDVSTDITSNELTVNTTGLNAPGPFSPANP